MNGKIIKSIMAVLLVCSISVPLSGCALVNPDVRENFENWTDDFLGGIFGDADDGDEDDKKDPSTDDSTNSGNEGGENGNENTGTENEGSTTQKPVNTVKISGERIEDHVNCVYVYPSKTTVLLNATFVIEAGIITSELGLEDPVPEDPTFTVAEEYTSIVSVDSVGNAYAKGIGIGYITVAFGELVYEVEVTVTDDAQATDTYIIACTHIYEDHNVVIVPHEIKMRVGDSFTFFVEDSRYDSVEVTVEYLSNMSTIMKIDGMTMTATAPGQSMFILSWEESHPYAYAPTVIVIE